MMKENQVEDMIKSIRRSFDVRVSEYGLDEAIDWLITCIATYSITVQTEVKGPM